MSMDRVDLGSVVLFCSFSGAEVHENMIPITNRPVNILLPHFFNGIMCDCMT